jgi:hypothetical protein
MVVIAVGSCSLGSTQTIFGIIETPPPLASETVSVKLLALWTCTNCDPVRIGETSMGKFLATLP